MVNARHGVVAVVLGCTLLAAQTRISLGGVGGRSELERACLRLAQSETRAAAITTLRRSGAPAVPLLVATAERGDAASQAALRVLADLGGVARSAAPALRRLVAAAGPHAATAAEALAAIGERDSIVLTDWNGNHVIELDVSGKELRRVAIDKPWTVQPIAGDRLLVGCYSAKKVVELDWDGKIEREFAVPEGPMLARRTVDGRTWVAGEAKLRVFDPGGKELLAFDAGGRQFAVLDDDSVLLMGPGEAGFRRLTAAGEVVDVAGLPQAGEGSGMGFHRDAMGSLAVVYDAHGKVLDAGGQELRKLPAGGWCVQVLPGGRVVIGGSAGVALYDRDGVETWRQKVGQIGFLVARIEPPGN